MSHSASAAKPVHKLPRIARGRVSKADGEKVSLYLTADAAQTLRDAADRLDRTLSWIVQQVIASAVPGLVSRYDVAVKARASGAKSAK